LAETWVKVLIGLTVVVFLALCYLWKTPRTDFGKISLRLCVVNAVGWLVVLPLSNKGHPPSWVLGIMVFWLVNLILLPSIAVLLWICRKDQQERRSYLALASIYVALSVVLLYILPIVGLILEETRH
jgi:hypothetical protein